MNGQTTLRVGPTEANRVNAHHRLYWVWDEYRAGASPPSGRFLGELGSGGGAGASAPHVPACGGSLTMTGSTGRLRPDPPPHTGPPSARDQATRPCCRSAGTSGRRSTRSAPRTLGSVECRSSRVAVGGYGFNRHSRAYRVTERQYGMLRSIMASTSRKPAMAPTTRAWPSPATS
jgi:hypothetical protein